MSSSAITDLSYYQSQVTTSKNLISTLTAQIPGLQSQIAALTARLQPDYAGLNTLYNANNPRPDNASDVYSVDINNINSQLMPLQNQLSSIQGQITTNQNTVSTLSPIISQLQSNISQYLTATPISASNPSPTSDTAHTIASSLGTVFTTVTTDIKQIPSTYLLFGAGIVLLALFA